MSCWDPLAVVGVLHLHYPSPDLLDHGNSPEYKQSQESIAHCVLQRYMGGEEVGEDQEENE